MPKQNKPTATDEDVGQRGEVTRHGGNKVHGDDLEGAIPSTPMAVERVDDRDEGTPK